MSSRLNEPVNAQTRIWRYDPQDYALSVAAAGRGTLSFWAMRVVELPEQSVGSETSAVIFSEKYTVLFQLFQSNCILNVLIFSGNMAEEHAHFVDIVAVAFYPLPTSVWRSAHIPEHTFSTAYVMSLWRRVASRPIEHPLLHFTSTHRRGDIQPEDLTPVGRDARVLAALQFSQAVVDRITGLNSNPDRPVPNLWVDELNFSVARHRRPVYLVASPAGVETAVVETVETHDTRDDTADIALLAAATPEDT